MTSEKLLSKLEKYELEAYDGGYGTDWLEEIGENLKFYVKDCVDNKKQVTMSGFIQWIDGLALKAGESR